VRSLNLSTAAGIALAEAVRQTSKGAGVNMFSSGSSLY